MLRSTSIKKILSMVIQLQLFRLVVQFPLAEFDILDFEFGSEVLMVLSLYRMFESPSVLCVGIVWCLMLAGRQTCHA